MELKKLEEKKSIKTQSQLNDLFQKPEFNLVGNYGLVTYAMLFTAMYNNFLPWGSLVTMCLMTVIYWAFKYELINQCSVIRDVSYQMNQTMLDTLEFYIIIVALGQFILDTVKTD